MKKRMIFTLLLCFIHFNKLFSQTTVEEYNYVTKGIKVQVESGLDMKKGYSIEKVDQVRTNERSAILYKLIKNASNGSYTAAFVLEYRKGGIVDYICIPQPNSSKEITDAYFSKIYDGVTPSSEKLQLFTFLISRNLVWQ